MTLLQSGNREQKFRNFCHTLLKFVKTRRKISLNEQIPFKTVQHVPKQPVNIRVHASTSLKTAPELCALNILQTKYGKNYEISDLPRLMATRHEHTLGSFKHTPLHPWHTSATSRPDSALSGCQHYRNVHDQVWCRACTKQLVES